jgi:HEAT repeat protein
MIALNVRRCGLLAVMALIALGAGCASRPAAVAPPPPAPALPLDTKVAWILRLEQQRVLHDEGVEVAPSDAPTAGTPFGPARAPDLRALLADTDPAVRRRAALAIGRVGRVEGVPPLLTALSDPEDAVRAAAAFALGLIGSDTAVEPLEAILNDASASVRGRAVEALGLIGRPTAAAPIADAAAASCAPVLAPLSADAEGAGANADVEFCKLALFALVRLGDYHHLARVALDQTGQPVSTWWPIAFALQRIGDKRAVPALLKLAAADGVYTPAFALRGLAAAGERSAGPIAQAVMARPNVDVRLRVAAIRAVGELGGGMAADALLTLARSKDTPRNVALEAVAALGASGDARAFDALLDLLTDPWPAMRAAALTAAARTNPDNFLVVASGLPADPDWSVRAALASVFATLPAEQVRAGLLDLSRDKDPRVQGPALRALARVGAPELTSRLFEALQSDDFVVRATAAELIGETKPAEGIDRLTAAYARGNTDASYIARAAALAALAKYGTEPAKVVLHQALDDKSWPVRWRAAELLRSLGETGAQPSLPAPLRQPASYFESAGLLHPTVSPHAFIESKKGTIEIELNLVEAPVTSQSFIDLARLGFFNGVKIHRVVPNFVVQDGDPRGDREGGPGFTLMDELSPLPFVRGTIGMALDWRDTAGSQFFITLSPQPQLDAKYTVFGRVVHGEEVLDQLSQWDVIDHVRIWDGVTLQ